MPSKSTKGMEGAQSSSNSKKISLNAFLNRYKVSKGEDFTHTSLLDPKGSFYVPPEHLDTFWDIYSKEVLKRTPLYITEKPNGYSPVLIDLDFRQKTFERAYTQEDIITFLKAYVECAKEFFCDVEKARFYVMEKPSPREVKGIVKDGVHILCPDIVSRSIVQVMLRRRLLGKIDEIFAGKYVNKSADIFDEAVITTNNWFMYGSKKPDDVAGYTISYIFDGVSGEVLPFDSDDVNKELIEMLSIRKYLATPLQNGKQEMIDAYLEEQASARRAQEQAKLQQKIKNMTSNANDEDAYEKAKPFVAMLSSERANNRNDWIRVGWCLSNIDRRLLLEWDEFSKLSSKYQEGVCEKEWNAMTTNGGLGMGSLRMWAKEDSPEQYEAFLKRSLGTLVRACFPNKTEYDVARVVKQKYEGLFVYDTTEKNWYRFAHHKWRVDNEGLVLQAHLPEEVAQVFRSAAAVALGNASQEEDAMEKEKLDNYAKVLQEINIKLKSPKYQNGVMSQLRMLMGVEKFSTQLDTKTHLIGFENGVYDLNEMMFRDGLSEDMISMTTGYNFVSKDDVKEYVDEVMRLVRSMMATEEMMNYLLTTLGMNLHGTKQQELMYFWTGKGRNGKGLLAALYRLALGMLYYECSVVMLTNIKKSAAAAAPEIMKMKGVRGLITSEPEEGETLQASFLKNIIGMDMFSARGLYKDLGDGFKPQAQLIISMNEKPSISCVLTMDMKLRILIFPHQFVENPTKPNERQIDGSLKGKIENDVRYRQAFMHILLDYWKSYKESGYKLHTPQCVIDETSSYLKDNDVVGKYLDDNYTKSKEDEVGKFVISAKALFADFKKKTGSVKKEKAFLERVVNAGYNVIDVYDKAPYRNRRVITGIVDKNYVFDDNLNEE